MIDRLTRKTEDGYIAMDTALAVQRLGRIEDMYESLCVERDRLAEVLAELSDVGRTKTATYHQLFAKKLTIVSMLASLETHMIIV